MSCIRNVLSIFLLAALGMGFSTSVQAEEFASEETQGIDSLSMMLLTLPRLPQARKELNFKSNDQKFAEKREDISFLLQNAQQLIREKNFAKAELKLEMLDNIDGKTAEETYVIYRTTVAVASATDNVPMLIKSLDAVISTNQLSPEEQLQFIQALASLYYRQKNYPKTIAWATRYIGEGGTDADIRVKRTRAYYLNNEYSQAASELRVEIQGTEAAGKIPTQAQMRLLSSSEFKAGNQAGFIDALEKSAVHYPATEDWAELLNYVMSKPEFNDGLALDIYRFMFKTGQFNTASDFTDMAQIAMQMGFPAEAKQILSEGLRLGMLGKGSEAAFHKRLLDVTSFRIAAKAKTLAKDEAEMISAKDGGGLAYIGYVYVTEGQVEKGISLIEQGFQIGGIRRPDMARLHLGIAKALAGRNAEAIETLKSVSGTDGTADLARYWAIYLSRSLSSG